MIPSLLMLISLMLSLSGFFLVGGFLELVGCESVVAISPWWNYLLPSPSWFSTVAFLVAHNFCILYVHYELYILLSQLYLPPPRLEITNSRITFILSQVLGHGGLIYSPNSLYPWRHIWGRDWKVRGSLGVHRCHLSQNLEWSLFDQQ